MSYPTSISTFTTKNNGDVIQPSHVNALQTEITAIETALINGFPATFIPLTDATYDLGSAAKKFRDLFLSRNALVGGTFGVTGTTTLAATVVAALTASGAAILQSTLAVTGTTTISTATISGVVTASGTTNLSGVVNIGAGGWASFNAAVTPQVSINPSVVASGMVAAIANTTVSTTGNPIVSFDNLDTTDNNWNELQFRQADLTPSALLDAARYGIQVTSHTAGNLSADHVWKVKSNIEAMRLTATKALKVQSTITEQNRAFAMGVTQNQTYAGGDYTATGGGSFTVDSGDVLSNKYRVIGDTLFWTVYLSTATISGTVSNLNFKIPGGFTAQESTRTASPLVSDGSGAVLVNLTGVAAATTVTISPVTGANFTAGTNNCIIGFQLMLKVS